MSKMMEEMMKEAVDADRVRMAFLMLDDKLSFDLIAKYTHLTIETLNAMKQFQESMKGEAEKAGFLSEDDIAAWITESRRKERETNKLNKAKALDNLMSKLIEAETSIREHGTISSEELEAELMGQNS